MMFSFIDEKAKTKMRLIYSRQRMLRKELKLQGRPLTLEAMQLPLCLLLELFRKWTIKSLVS